MARVKSRPEPSSFASIVARWFIVCAARASSANLKAATIANNTPTTAARAILLERVTEVLHLLNAVFDGLVASFRTVLWLLQFLQTIDLCLRCLALRSLPLGIIRWYDCQTFRLAFADVRIRLFIVVEVALLVFPNAIGKASRLLLVSRVSELDFETTFTVADDCVLARSRTAHNEKSPRIYSINWIVQNKSVEVSATIFAHRVSI